MTGMLKADLDKVDSETSEKITFSRGQQCCGFDSIDMILLLIDSLIS